MDVIGVNMNSVKHPLFVVNEYDSVNNVTTVYTDVSKVWMTITIAQIQ